MSAEKLISDTVLPTLKDIQDRLTVLELKNQSDNIVNSQENAAGVSNSEQIQNGESAGGELGAFRQTNESIKHFECIKEKLAKISLPPNLKLNESSVGIKQDSKSALKIISKSARFAETTIKQLSVFSASQE